MTASPIAGEQAVPSRRRSAAPLLAVCGVCGGAGASTLSYLIAREIVAREAGHVLVCDTGGTTGGLALRAGVESAHSLAEASDYVARGLPLAGGLYTIDRRASRHGCELRVIATGPRLVSPGHPKGLRTLLTMARSDGAHTRVIVDCGTLQRAADRLALRCASHVAWILPATDDGLRRAERFLTCIPPGDRTELVVARRDPTGRSARIRRLQTLADTCRALVLMPYASRDDEMQPSLQAILGALER